MTDSPGTGQPARDSSGMKISVIIPVRNEAASIGDLLTSLLNQTLKPAEVVITDAGSTDATLRIISEYVISGAPVRLFREVDALPGRGRNVGAAEAANEWLAFIDAGIMPEANWLELLAERALQGDVDVVYGSFEPVAETLFKRCAVMAYVAPPVEVEGKLVRTRSIASVLMKRSVWKTVDGFPEDLRSAEDLLFMNKIEQENFSVAHAPEALVHWQVQATPWLTFKRFVTYARNNMRAGLWRQWQAAIFTRYGLLMVSALPVFWFGRRWLLLTVLLWIAMLAARAAVAIRRNRFSCPGSIVENAVRLLVLAPLIAMLDAATIIGTAEWAVKDMMNRQDAGIAK
jgi:glycosyltransferase involved in cell wall biosynthesis